MEISLSTFLQLMKYSSDLINFQNEMHEKLPDAIKEMAASQPPLLRCLEENYTITYQFMDKYKILICETSFTPDDYKQDN